jgi:N6-adenosine-specific RNA methylase IME4
MIPAGTYDIIYADPPWKFASNSVAKPGRNAMRHYPCMTDAEICALPVIDHAARASLLLMWTTAPMLVRSLEILPAWGFTYKSQLVWVKDRIGTGFWVRNRHEILIIGRRGKFPCPRPAPFSDSVINGGQREHSRKPPCVYEMIEATWPDARKVELFARYDRRGWASFGTEIHKFEEA